MLNRTKPNKIYDLLAVFSFICLLSEGFSFARENNLEPNGSDRDRILSVGITYLGGQIRWRFSDRWAMEGRYLQDTTDTIDGRLTAHVTSVRGYRFWKVQQRFQPFLGLEMGATNTNGDTAELETHGYLAGGFLGAEYPITRRVFIGLDFGSYYLTSKTDKNASTQSGIDFVMNSYVNFTLW